MKQYYLTKAFGLLLILAGIMSIAYVSVVNAYELEIINLNHRPASEIIPILKPLLDKDGTISGEKYVLFLRTSYKNFEQLKTAIATLDADFRQLSISIMQESAAAMKRYGYNVKKDTKQTNAIIYSTQHQSANPNQQTIQVTEGQWATLQTGMSIPSLSRTQNADGTITESIQYTSIFTRLKIHPLINGDKVNIKVLSVTGDKETIKAESSQGLNTTVTGTLGQWIALGGITTASDNNNSGFVFSTQHTSDSTRQIFIKIDITTSQD